MDEQLRTISIIIISVKNKIEYLVEKEKNKKLK